MAPENEGRGGGVGYDHAALRPRLHDVATPWLRRMKAEGGGVGYDHAALRPRLTYVAAPRLPKRQKQDNGRRFTRPYGHA
ncbi:MAG: hypothetical protein ACFCD0_01035 [Gemmataceae bacterium]